MTGSPRAVLLDIEGTTTPASFVYDVLFPFARERAGEFLAQHWGDADVREDVARLRAEHADDQASAQAGSDPPPWRDDAEAVAGYVRWSMDRDRKSTGLKGLQGKIWRAGYENGPLRGQVYPDVAPAFADWKAAGTVIAIYSSGSVLAQKLLFGKSSAGDLTPYIAAYFDTTSGPKREPDSYLKISKSLGYSPGTIRFVSDVVAELDAANAAGLEVVLSLRPGNAPQPERDYRIIQSLAELG